MSAGVQTALVLLIGGALALAAGLYLVWPLIARAKSMPGPAAAELTLLKGQLAEIDRDAARGALSEADAQAARREIARKILAADAALSEQDDYRPAPERFSQRAALVVAATLVLGGIGVYAVIGAPGLPDRPLAQRDIAAERRALLLPQADAQARFGQAAATPADEGFDRLVTETLAVLQDRPNDAEGRLILSRALMSRGRHAEAWPLLDAAINLLGDETPVEMHGVLGEAMTLAAGGYVSQEAEAVFARAPNTRAGLYFLGLAAAQRQTREDGEQAVQMWSTLLARIKSDPSTEPEQIQQLEAQLRRIATDIQLDADILIEQINAQVRRPAEEPSLPPGQAPADIPPGPSEEELEAAAQLTAQERMEMIRGMVDGLAARLAQDPNDLDGWLRLIRSFGVLGEDAQAKQAYADALTAFGEDAPARARLDAAAREAGIL